VNTLPSAIVIGGGGHAKVLMDLLHLLGWKVVGYTDLNPGSRDILGVPCLGADDVVARWRPDEVQLVNGVGSIASPRARVQVFEDFKRRGYTFPPVVHGSAVVSPDAVLDQGVQVMAGAVIQAGCRIGQNVIVNTRASVDHDCAISAHVHIAPGAVLSGGVQVAERAHIGAGATVIEGLTIGADVIVGAGAVVINSIPPGVIVVGVPAKILRRRLEGNNPTGPNA
jgi:sugar O-acyltransferase (sialic acid O-acetyltransferase NeuD family)